MAKKRADAFRTYLVDIDGGKPQPVTPEGMVCTWASPDGKSALCEPGTDGISLIYSLDDKQARPARGLSVKDKVISWSADGTALFIRARPEFPPRIYRLDLASGKRELWREIGPPDRAGLFYDWMSVVMTPDGALVLLYNPERAQRSLSRGGTAIKVTEGRPMVNGPVTAASCVAVRRLRAGRLHRRVAQIRSSPERSGSAPSSPEVLIGTAG